MAQTTRTSLLFFVAVSLGLSQPSALTGVISASDGSPLVGALVSYSRLVAYAPKTRGAARLAPGEVRAGGSVRTDSSGGVSVPKLPGGKYAICVEMPTQPLLNPCDWETPPLVQVGNGQLANVKVKLRKGVFVKVRVVDTQRLLRVSEGKLFDFADIAVGIRFGNGAFLRAKRVSSDSAGHDYRIAVPTGVPLELRIYSPRVFLADSLGKTYPGNGGVLGFVASQGVDEEFAVNVAGLKPARR